MIVYATAFELAVKDAFENMEKQGATAFVYPIGTVKGQAVKLVYEPDEGVYETVHFDANWCFEAIAE